MNADFEKELSRLRNLATGLMEAIVVEDRAVAEGEVGNGGRAPDSGAPDLSDPAWIEDSRTVRELRAALEEFDVRFGMLEGRYFKLGEGRHWASRMVALEATARTLEAALAAMSRNLLRVADESVENQNKAALLDRFAFEFEERFGRKREDVVNRLAGIVDLIADQDVVRSCGREDCRVLDIGCGRGEWLEALRAAGFTSTVGVDASEEMIRACQRHDLAAIRSDLRKYLQSLPDASVAVVTAFGIFDRFGTGNALALLKEARRILVPGGLILVSGGESAAVQAARECGSPISAEAVAGAGAFIVFALEFSGFDGALAHGDMETHQAVSPIGRRSVFSLVSCRKP